MQYTRNAAMLVAMAIAGCAPSAGDVANVSGTVTLDGNPLADARVFFQPAEGRPSFGRTDAQGGYRLLYTPGALGARIGPAVVTISTATEDDDGKRTRDRVPKRYLEPGALTAEVKPGNNVLDFNLTSEK
jgi:hypothetical protein